MQAVPVVVALVLPYSEIKDLKTTFRHDSEYHLGELFEGQLLNLKKVV